MTSDSHLEWNPQVMLDLLSRDRMTTYLDACEGQVDEAFSLYQHNLEIAASIQGMTAMVEVVVRNAIDRSLMDLVSTRGSGEDWFDLPVLDIKARADVRTARDRIRRVKKSVEHSRVLAELSFGFWRFLTSKRYLTSLWIPATQYAFPHGHKDARTRQQQVSAALTDMTFIRNRAAHLEPVFRRNLSGSSYLGVGHRLSLPLTRSVRRR